VVVAGDVFYDEAVAASAAVALDAAWGALGPKTEVLVGDIGRRFLPRDRLAPLASYPVRDLGDPPGAPLREGWVFRWNPQSER
jgi:predicted nicotinamide N-methyase